VVSLKAEAAREIEVLLRIADSLRTCEQTIKEADTTRVAYYHREVERRTYEQISESTHLSHKGFLALQTFLP